jgi:uncharacterized protein GlcG (DUF336 family)
MALTYEQANAALQAAIAKAQEVGITLGISVVDAGGQLMAMARMTGANGATADVSAGKARVSAMYGVPSAAMAERLPANIVNAMITAHNGRLVYSLGGVPIKVGDEVIGGIGASGSAPDNDELCSKVGAGAVSA